MSLRCVAAEHTGAIDGFDDPSMGWARFAQLYKHFNMNSGLFYVRANERTLDMMSRLEQRLAKEKFWDQTAYNEAIFFLSHDEYKSPQVLLDSGGGGGKRCIMDG